MEKGRPTTAALLALPPVIFISIWDRVPLAPSFLKRLVHKDMT